MRILPDPISRQSNKAIVQKREFWLPVGFFLTQEENFQQKPACRSVPIGGLFRAVYIVDALLRCADWRSGNYREVADLRARVKQINAHRIGTGSKKVLNFWTLIDARVPT